MMPDPRTTTARQVPEGTPRAVSFKARASMEVRRAHWREAAQMSAVVFFLSLGLGAMAWSWYLGDGTIWHAIAPSRGGMRGAKAEEVVEAPRSATKRRAIDGVAVPENVPDAKRYYAVAIDNIPAARPQAGVNDAAVVIEAPVEGGLTRWLAIFPDTAETSHIGPVRSARPYFIDWAREYDAMYVHVGGSPEALEKISQTNTRDLNEFFSGAYFSRDPHRPMPHNAYVAMEDLRAADAARFPDRAEAALRAWKFKDDADMEERADTQVLAVRYGHPNVDVVWTYDKERNAYVRGHGDAVRLEDGSAVPAKNVVVQFTEVATIDAVGRRRVRTTGSGEAIVAMDGVSFAAEWRKPSPTDRTVYYDGSGNEIRFNPGTTWINVVPIGTVVEITPK